MDKAARSILPCILMLVIIVTVPMTNMTTNHDSSFVTDDISNATVKSQTTWSGVVELTESYTIDVSDELIIAPCTLVKLSSASRIFVEGRLSIEGDLALSLIHI